MTRLYHLLSILALLSVASAWLLTPVPSTVHRQSSAALHMVAKEPPKLKKKKKGYEPKWKKQATLAEKLGTTAEDPTEVGLVGTISVVFKQGNVTRTTMAIPGQPLSDVATQAGQFIKYGCGKGECGTCESLCNGQWIRPCSEVVPATEGELVIVVKEVKNKSKSSGKFFSARSFLFGFYNNVLGMFAFVKTRRYASDNWKLRQEYEDNLKKKIEEKRKAREAAEAAQKKE